MGHRGMIYGTVKRRGRCAAVACAVWRSVTTAPRFIVPALLLMLTASSGCAVRLNWLVERETTPPRPRAEAAIVSLTDDAGHVSQSQASNRDIILCSGPGEGRTAFDDQRPSAERNHLRREQRAALREYITVLPRSHLTNKPVDFQTPKPMYVAARRPLVAPATVRQSESDPMGTREGIQEPSPGTAEGDDFKPITAITTHITPPAASEEIEAADLMPTDYAAMAFARHGHAHYRSDAYVPWSAYSAPSVTQNFCHRPLYFEEVNVERYGDSAGAFQPAISAARFFGTIPLLPYKMALQRPADCTVDDSPYPPGSAAPRHREVPPLRIGPALVEAATMIGLIALIP